MADINAFASMEWPRYIPNDKVFKKKKLATTIVK